MIPSDTPMIVQVMIATGYGIATATALILFGWALARYFVMAPPLVLERAYGALPGRDPRVTREGAHTPARVRERQDETYVWPLRTRIRAVADRTVDLTAAISTVQTHERRRLA